MGAFALLLPFAQDLLKRLLPDADARAQAEAELQRMDKNGELAALAAQTDLLRGQLDINRVEAAHASVFVAGWRPFIGWTIGIAFFFKYVGGPSVQLLARLAGHDVELPDISAGELTPLLGAMLGVGALAYADKKART